MGESGGSNEGGVLDAYPVVDFVTFAKTTENGNGVFDGRFGHGDGLEAAF